MRITTRGRYALRASLALSRMSKDGSPVPISRLSERENISSVFLEQIFFKLRKAHLVDSVRGPGGGFKFSKPLKEITVKEILDAAGEGLVLSPCGTGRAACSDVNDCVSFSIWAEATKLVNAYFQSLTIGDILEKYKGSFDRFELGCPSEATR